MPEFCLSYVICLWQAICLLHEWFPLMYKYEIVLRNEKEKTYFIIGCILLFFNFIALITLTIAGGFNKLGPFILSILAILALYLGWYFKKPKEKQYLFAPFLFFSLAWFVTPYPLFGFVNLLFQALDALTRKKLLVRVFDDRIIYPSLINKNISWNEINNLVLKDGILTIDLKNNKLIQQYADEKDNPINEIEFNDFCESRLTIDHRP